MDGDRPTHRIEVTPEMIEAGVICLLEFQTALDSEALVERVYRVMNFAREAKGIDPVSLVYAVR